jgi:hypothetical protein
LIEAHGWKGEAKEARGKACPDRRRLEQRKGGGGRRSTDRWDRPVSNTGEKKKRRCELGCCGRELMGRWADWAEREVRSFSLFFFFSTSFKSNLLKSKPFKPFSNFFTKFCKLFKPHTSNQNHA